MRGFKRSHQHVNMFKSDLTKQGRKAVSQTVHTPQLNKVKLFDYNMVARWFKICIFAILTAKRYWQIEKKLHLI